MEYDKTPSTEYQAVLDLQMKHWHLLQGSVVIKKIMAHAEFAGDLDTVLTGWPIVLGSESQEVRHLFLAFREPSTSEIYPVRSQYFTVGTSIGQAIMPNQRLGLTDEDFVFVDALFSEAVALRASLAPHYSLESGLIREDQ